MEIAGPTACEVLAAEFVPWPGQWDRACRRLTQRGESVESERRDIKISGAVRDLHHLRLMALLLELVRLRGISGTARVLEIDPRTVTSSVQSDQLTHRVRDSLERALQHGIGSAADRQRERNDKLEGRLDKIESQLKEFKTDLRSGPQDIGQAGG